jgi:protein-S-isoprenylcysteine O-methyltransferase Ste14
MTAGTFYLIGASILWGVLHSVLASHGYKGLVRRIAGEEAFERLYRLSYNMFSAASLFPILMMLVTFPDTPLYSIPSPWLYLTTIIQGLAAMALVAGVMQTGPFEFIGLAQLSGPIKKESTLVTDGLYARVRHPLYTAGLVFIWFSPEMTVNRLALWIVFSLYILIGAYFEERKLLRDFGAVYAEYKARTPFLIPKISKS